MGRISDSESEEIQRNLERFMDQQIKEYEYTKGESGAINRKAESTYKSMEIDVPNLEAPKTGRRTAVSGDERGSDRTSTLYSYIDIDRDGYSSRSYDDDLDDDFDPEDYRHEKKRKKTRRYEDDLEEDYEEGRRERSSKSKRKKEKKKKDDYEPYYEEDMIQDNPKGKKKKKKKKHTFLKVFIILLILLALIAGGIFFAWRFLVGDAYDKMSYKPVKKYTNTALTENGVTNILLLGNDSRDNADDGRTDSIMLLTINRPQKKIYLTSFLRDIKIDIPGKGINRLNQSYAFGGPELVMQTLSENFDIKISRYMLVNFQAFAKLADAVGGIDMDVTAEEVDWINAYLWEYNDLNGDDIHKDNFPDGTSGNLHLNGPQALAYCRNRYIGTDFERSNRQKKVITAIVSKLPNALMTNLGGVMNGLFPNLTTSLTKDDCYDLSLLITSLKGMEIVQSTVPQDHTWKFETYKEMELISIDFDDNKAYLKKIMSAD